MKERDRIIPRTILMRSNVDLIRSDRNTHKHTPVPSPPSTVVQILWYTVTSLSGIKCFDVGGIDFKVPTLKIGLNSS